MITAQQQSLAAGALVTLYELDLTALDGPTLRFTPAVDGSGQPIRFGGMEYSPIPLLAEGFERSSQGPAQRPALTVSNVLGELAGLARLYQSFRGASLIRARTFADYLDSGATPDGSAILARDSYIISRLILQNNQQMQWELRSALDRPGVRLPRLQALADTCRFRYRIWRDGGWVYAGGVMQCPYVGGAYFTDQDTQTWVAQEDNCGHRLTSCRLRFPPGAPLPFGGFPHLSKGRYK